MSVLRRPAVLCGGGAVRLPRDQEGAARAQRHPKLWRLIGHFTALAAAFSLLKSHLEHGDTSSINGVQSSISSADRTSTGLGSPIKTLTSGINL